MKVIHLFLLTIILIFSRSASASEHTEHRHAAATHTKLTLNNGNKWNTDETLRDAMKNIHASVAKALPTIHTGKFSPAQYHALGDDIAGQLSLIIKNCKLDPEADQQLHLIIASIAEGIELTTSKKSQRKRTLGIHKIAESVNDYGKYFDHPDWQMLALSPH